MMQVERWLGRKNRQVSLQTAEATMFAFQPATTKARTDALALPPAHLLQQADAHAVSHRGHNLIGHQPWDGCTDKERGVWRRVDQEKGRSGLRTNRNSQRETQRAGKRRVAACTSSLAIRPLL